VPDGEVPDCTFVKQWLFGLRLFAPNAGQYREGDEQCRGKHAHGQVSAESIWNRTRTRLLMIKRRSKHKVGLSIVSLEWWITLSSLIHTVLLGEYSKRVRSY